MKTRQKKKAEVPDHPIVYPYGTCVKTESGFFLIRDGKRYKLPTQRILESWNFHRIVESSEAAVRNYRFAAKIGFRDGSLIYDMTDGKIYLVANNERRHVRSPEALELIGCTANDAVVVSHYEANLQREGDVLE